MGEIAAYLIEQIIDQKIEDFFIMKSEDICIFEDAIGVLEVIYETRALKNDKDRVKIAMDILSEILDEMNKESKNFHRNINNYPPY